MLADIFMTEASPEPPHTCRGLHTLSLFSLLVLE